MRETHTVSELRVAVRESVCSGREVGFIPTMGALHAGHAALMTAARARGDLVVTSIFVNPTQFAPSEDLDRYPRDLDHDRSIADVAGADILFVPALSEMYPDGPEQQSFWVDPGDMASFLDGAARPNHFRGVCTVLVKLFTIVQPNRAYFGQKDFQQARIVQQLAHDLMPTIDIVVVPTVREVDGLAMSSRNRYLMPDERHQATALFHALTHAQESVRAGERHVSRLISDAREAIGVEAPDGRIEFVEVADSYSLHPVSGTLERASVMALSVFFSSTRLIDNVMLTI